MSCMPFLRQCLHPFQFFNTGEIDEQKGSAHSSVKFVHVDGGDDAVLLARRDRLFDRSVQNRRVELTGH